MNWKRCLSLFHCNIYTFKFVVMIHKNTTFLDSWCSKNRNSTIVNNDGFVCKIKVHVWLCGFVVLSHENSTIVNAWFWIRGGPILPTLCSFCFVILTARNPVRWPWRSKKYIRGPYSWLGYATRIACGVPAWLGGPRLAPATRGPRFWKCYKFLFSVLEIITTTLKVEHYTTLHTTIHTTILKVHPIPWPWNKST